MSIRTEKYTNLGRNSPKHRTYFIDIDGTILAHLSNGDLDLLDHYLEQNDFGSIEQKTIILPHYLEWQDSIPKSTKIVLTTARLHRHKHITEYQLRTVGVVWDDIVYECNSGPRVLVNDLKPIKALDNDTKSVMTTAYAVNLVRNAGFEDVLNFDKRTFNS